MNDTEPQPPQPTRQKRRWPWFLLGVLLGSEAPPDEVVTVYQGSPAVYGEPVIAVTQTGDEYVADVDYPDDLPPSSHSIIATILDGDGVQLDVPSLRYELGVLGTETDARITFRLSCESEPVTLVVSDLVGNYPRATVRLDYLCERVDDVAATIVGPGIGSRQS